MDPNQSVQQIPQHQDQSSLWNKILFSLVIVFLLCLATSGGYYLGLQKQPVVTVLYPAPTSSVTVSPTIAQSGSTSALPVASPKIIPPVSVSNGTALYKNNTYGYAINYPANLNAVEYSPSYVRFSFDDPTKDLPNSQTYVSIQIKDNPDKLSLADWVKKNWGESTMPVLVNKQDAYRAIHYLGGPQSDFFFLEHNGNIYQISSLVMNGDIVAYADHLQSIATFTFTQ